MSQRRVNRFAIKAIRESRGLKPSQLAELIRAQDPQFPRCHRDTIHNIERGEKDASEPMALAIARALNVPLMAIENARDAGPAPAREGEGPEEEPTGVSAALSVAPRTGTRNA